MNNTTTTYLTYTQVLKNMKSSIEGTDWGTLRTVSIDELVDNYQYICAGKIEDGFLITKITDHYEETVEIEKASMEDIEKAAKEVYSELQAEIAERFEEY